LVGSFLRSGTGWGRQRRSLGRLLEEPAGVGSYMCFLSVVPLLNRTSIRSFIRAVVDASGVRIPRPFTAPRPHLLPTRPYEAPRRNSSYRHQAKIRRIVVNDKVSREEPVAARQPIVTRGSPAALGCRPPRPVVQAPLEQRSSRPARCAAVPSAKAHAWPRRTAPGASLPRPGATRARAGTRPVLRGVTRAGEERPPARIPPELVVPSRYVVVAAGSPVPSGRLDIETRRRPRQTR